MAKEIHYNKRCGKKVSCIRYGTYCEECYQHSEFKSAKHVFETTYTQLNTIILQTDSIRKELDELKSYMDKKNDKRNKK